MISRIRLNTYLLNNMFVPFDDLKRQYQTIKKDIDEAYRCVMDSGKYILGEEVEAFEKEFSQYLGAKFCISVDSGTAALELALQAIDIKAKDEIIIPANSFIATALACSKLFAKPILVDCEKDSFNIDPAKIEEKITKKTKAIIPVHLYGQTANLDPILKLAKKYHLWVIEDSAQTHGALYKGKKAGTLGDLGCFSFYPTKNLGAYGDGGAIVTNNKNLAEKLLLLRNYGQTQKYHHLIKGGNHRLDSMQAAFLRVKLKHLDVWNKARRKKAQIYNELLRDLVPTPKEQKWAYHIYHLYVIKSKNRDALQKYLLEKGIQTQIHYPIPIHLQPAYKELGLKKGSFPVAEKLAKEIISLPIFTELTKKEIQYTVKQIGNFYQLK